MNIQPRIENKSTFLRWLHRGSELPYGTSPDEYEPTAVSQVLARAKTFFGPRRYFGLDVRGFENLPTGPVMLVSNHSGGTSIPDVWGLGVAWYQHVGESRPLHSLAHEMVLSTRLTGRFFSRLGVLRANPGIGYEVLTKWKRDLLVFPGGDLDTWRPYSKRYDVCFSGRTGYARLALRAGVPIVPVANAGAHETLIVLSTGRRIAEAMRLPSLVRARIFPISLSLPWGLTIGPLPHVPLPTKFRYRLGAPIYPERTSAEPTNAEILEHDRKVRSAMQGLLDDLREESQPRWLM